MEIQSGQQDASRKRVMEDEERVHLMEKKEKLTAVKVELEKDSDSDDDDVVFKRPLGRRELVLESLRQMYADYRSGKLKNRCIRPPPLPTRDSIPLDVLVGDLPGLLKEKEARPIPYYFSMVITRLALLALWSMKQTISKIRESIQFVKSSEARSAQFLEAKKYCGICSQREIIIDQPDEWDTTYRMLVAAFKLKKAFGCLSSYAVDFMIVVTTEEWKQVRNLLTYLNFFFDDAKLVSACPYASADAFFSVVAKLKGELKRGADCEDPFIKSLTTPLHLVFEGFWVNWRTELALAAVFDPRVKMGVVDRVYGQAYGESAKKQVDIVLQELRQLWSRYALPKEAPTEDETVHVKSPTSTSYTSFHVMIFNWKQSERARKKRFSELDELDQYMEEYTYCTGGRKGFDVVAWWVHNKPKFPTLSRMAFDVLTG